MIEYDYIREIENAREKDEDGNLGYTIHISKVTEIIATIESQYITLLKQIIDKEEEKKEIKNETKKI